MDKDYLYSLDEQIIKKVQTILESESMEIANEKINRISDEDYYKVLSVLGYEAYRQKKSGTAYNLLSRFDSTNNVIRKNNLAYMIRRKEIFNISNSERK